MKITKQDWENDTYKDEIQNVLKDEKGVEKGFGSAIASEVAETASQRSELWKAKATLLIQDLCDKYPKQKKQIEEADKNYWSSLDEKVEQVNENPFLEGNGALGAETRIEMGKEDLLKKPENIRAKIVEGRVNKIMAERCLLEQPFVKDPNQTIAQLIEGKLEIKAFTRYELGEGLEKRQDNFAEEVMAQVKG